MRESNSLLIVKRHPFDKNLEIPNGFSHIIDATSRNLDMQPLLCMSDALITDWSSCMFDFLLTDRPIFAYIYDLEDYLDNSRKMYYDLTEIIPGPTSRNIAELINQLQTSLLKDSYREKRLEMRKRFHQHIDGKATERAAEYLLSQMKLK